MLVHSPRLLLLLGPVLALAAVSADAQVVATETRVSSSEAFLRVQAADERELELSLRGGEVRLNGDRIGDYEDGGTLDRAWRRLLGRVASETASEAAALLTDWEPPAGLDEERLALARRLDESLAAIAAGGTAAVTALSQGDATDRERRLIERALATLVEGAGFEDAARAIHRVRDGRLDVRIGEDVEIPEGERHDGTLVVVDGDVEIRGELDGDLIVSDGTVSLEDSGRIRGDLHLLDARLDDDGGRVSGSVMRAMQDETDNVRIRREIREEIRSELRREMRASRANRGLFRGLGHGVSGILQLLVQLGIMVAIGMVLLHFVPERFARVAGAVRDYPARSAAVGMAGFFLLIPVWLLGIIALAVSIIGIPLLIAWVPLFPLAAGVATVGGLLAVSLNLGRWVQRHDFDKLRWAREENHVNHLILGVGTLLAGFMAANVIGVFGSWFDVFEGLLMSVGCMAVTAAAVVGFGAVLLTRGGRQEVYETGDLDFDWRPRWERASGASTAAAEDAFEDITDTTATAVEDLADAADAALEDLKDAVSDLADDAADLVENVDDEVFDALEDEPRPEEPND